MHRNTSERIEPSLHTGTEVPVEERRDSVEIQENIDGNSTARTENGAKKQQISRMPWSFLA